VFRPERSRPGARRPTTGASIDAAAFGAGGARANRESSASAPTLGTKSAVALGCRCSHATDSLCDHPADCEENRLGTTAESTDVAGLAWKAVPNPLGGLVEPQVRDFGPLEQDSRAGRSERSWATATWRFLLVSERAGVKCLIRAGESQEHKVKRQRG
jgi:hypothetical protein